MFSVSNKGVKIIKKVALLSFLCIMGSCSKLVEIPAPTNAITEENVYATDETAISVLTGIYTKMGNINSSRIFTGNLGISAICGLSVDELTLWSGVTSAKHIAYYQNALSVINKTGSDYWAPLYNYIVTCNAALEGLGSSNTLTPSIRRQLQGEAKFMRAFFYFYLVNLFGDVPLAITSDYRVNSVLARAPKATVYQQIISDLKDAKELLNTNFLDGSLLNISGDRLRPTKWAAMSLLSRAYLYTGDWANAEQQSDSVIQQASIFSLTSLGNVFLKNSSEAIWQLQPMVVGHNTEDGWTFIIPSTGPSNINGTRGYPFFLSNQLLGSFETGDNRRAIWVDSTVAHGITYFFPYKYQSAKINAPITEYLMVFRLAEQYLIRAEARAQTNNISGAESDINNVRNRAGLGNTMAADKGSLLAAILQERRVELFTEWGHRWFDLKRTNNIDEVMTGTTPGKANGVGWQSYQQLYPLPLSDVQEDLYLVQNPGY